MGREDKNGVNWMLRDDVNQFAEDAARLKKIAAFDQRQSDLLSRTQLQNLRTIARYYRYIADGWSVTPGTQQVFELARDSVSDALPPARESLTRTLRATKIDELAWRISKDGEPRMFPNGDGTDGT